MMAPIMNELLSDARSTSALAISSALPSGGLAGGVRLAAGIGGPWFLQGQAGAASVHVGAHVAGADRVDPHAARAVTHGELLGQVDEPALGSAVGNAEGRVAVAGFYDAVLPVAPEVRPDMAALPFSDEAYLRDVGAPGTFGAPGCSTLERQWYCPTLEVNGLWGATPAKAARPSCPARRTPSSRADLCPVRPRRGSGSGPQPTSGSTRLQESR